MLDAKDNATLERFCVDAPDSFKYRKLRRRIVRQARVAKANVNPSHPDDPEAFDFDKLAAGVELRPGGRENP